MSFWESLLGGICGISSGFTVGSYNAFGYRDQESRQRQQYYDEYFKRMAEAQSMNLSDLILRGFMRGSSNIKDIASRACMCAETLWNDIKMEVNNLNLKEEVLCSETIWS